AQSFLDAYDSTVSGCLVLDVNMPGMTGLELQKELIARGIKIPIVILTGGGDVSTARDAFRAGVVDFVLKPFHNAELLDCVAKALAKDAAMRAEEQVLRDARARFARLSERERQVIERIAEGKSTKEVAFEMSLSSKTVDSHRANSLKKMEVNSMAELFRLTMVLKGHKEERKSK
ncbi:MAG TPA: LuxR C-terminal-related transcriptional regulator, partial [Phycisphaerae bacterium]|nr:LuxR C-terminal-related transcriptional regulator [Phycisphaerae bacterium]